MICQNQVCNDGSHVRHTLFTLAAETLAYRLQRRADLSKSRICPLGATRLAHCRRTL